MPIKLAHTFSPSRRGTVEGSLLLAAATTVSAGAVISQAGNPANRWVLLADVTSTGLGTYPGAFECEADGPVAADAGTLTVIETTTTGWNGITNALDARPGAREFNGTDLVNVNGLQQDDGLETAIIISLFTDARATPDELKAAGLPEDDPRGYWGDTYPDVEGGVLGSKLWLLGRAKRTADTLAEAEGYASDALRWLIEDEIASDVTVEASWWKDSGLLVIGVAIQRPGELEPRWRRLWNAISGEPLNAN